MCTGHNMSWCASMTPTGGHSGGLIFQQPVHGNMMNVLKSIQKESLIFTAHSDLFVRAFEMLSNSLVIVPNHAKSSAEMRLKWQTEFIAAFIQCHDLLCSTWTCDEWHNRISQWSHFKSPLAQGKGSAFSAVCYMSPGLHTGWTAGEEIWRSKCWSGWASMTEQS